MGLDEKKILVVGTIFLDIKGFPEGTFLTQSRNAGRIEYVHGGVARNIAQDLAGLGCSPVFISICEEGIFGNDIIRRLRESNVNTDHIINVPEGIGVWMAIFDHEGDVHASISKRQDLSPLISLLEEKGDDLFRDCDGVLVEMDIDEKLAEKVIELSEKYGAGVYGVISNMTIAKERLDHIRRTRCFVCNRYEAGQLFDMHIPGGDPEGTLEILRANRKRLQIPAMIVTMDKDGCVYDEESGNSGICPAIKTQVKDSTGAGDAFFAGASAALICGESFQAGCELGTMMAAKVLGTDENVYKP